MRVPRPECGSVRKVFKYQLEVTDYWRVRIPAGAQWLHVAEQAGNLCLWALVDEERLPSLYTFRIAGTGHEISDEDAARYSEFIGTAIMAGGRLVFHVFAESRQ